MMPHSPISFQLLVKSLLIVIYDTPSFLMIFAWLTWKRGNGSTNTTGGGNGMVVLGLLLYGGPSPPPPIPHNLLFKKAKPHN